MISVILAAGVGSRLGSDVPKGLLVLPSGETILARQVRLMKAVGIDDIAVVVGFKRELIEKALTGVRFKTNMDYATTNTAKSLLCGLDGVDDDVLWANGDVVFDETIIPMFTSLSHNVILVNKARCDKEEVKYVADNKGRISAVSKQIQDGQGEALGINMVKRESLDSLRQALQRCSDSDYFERAIQYLVDDGTVFRALSISGQRCIEVDFEEDWQQAIEMFDSERP